MPGAWVLSNGSVDSGRQEKAERLGTLRHARQPLGMYILALVAEEQGTTEHPEHTEQQPFFFRVFGVFRG